MINQAMTVKWGILSLFAGVPGIQYVIFLIQNSKVVFTEDFLDNIHAKITYFRFVFIK